MWWTDWLKFSVSVKRTIVDIHMKENTLTERLLDQNKTQVSFFSETNDFLLCLCQWFLRPEKWWEMQAGQEPNEHTTGRKRQKAGHSIHNARHKRHNTRHNRHNTRYNRHNTRNNRHIIRHNRHKAGRRRHNVRHNSNETKLEKEATDTIWQSRIGSAKKAQDNNGWLKRVETLDRVPAWLWRVQKKVGWGTWQVYMKSSVKYQLDHRH